MGMYFFQETQRRVIMTMVMMAVVTGSHDKLNVNAETHHNFGCWLYP